LASAGEKTIIYGFNVELPPAIKKISHSWSRGSAYL
jgi:hypothetical protein